MAAVKLPWLIPAELLLWLCRFSSLDHSLPNFEYWWLPKMAYSLASSYVGESLLSGFNWFDGRDPSNGYVNYQSRSNAEALGLFSVDNNTGVVRLGVDHTNAYGLGEGRPSIRLESKATYNEGLFIADFLHMPSSECVWSYGTNWPHGGEVDIIEGVNTAHENIISAHTADGCTQSAPLKGMFSGQQRNVDCAVGSMNIGCGFSPSAEDTSSYGDGFNAVNGGVYAMKWDSEHIQIWHFAREEIPRDIQSKRPDPRGWKLPDAIFGGPSCDVRSFFKDMSLVININFCGDYGNAVWGKTDQCDKYASTCAEYVGNNPQAFANAYWDVRYIEAYQLSNGTAQTAEPTTTTTTMTSLSTTTVTVGGRSPGTATSPSSFAPHEPFATGGPVNPAKIGKFAYLGCFGSSSGFQTFTKAKDNANMTLEVCVAACETSRFVGIFESKCYCASALDADTRATSPEEGGVCDHACPGDPRKFCGGLIEQSDGDDKPRLGNETRHDALRTSSRRIVRRGIPDTFLLTVYGAVGGGNNGSAPPPMAPGSNLTHSNVVATATAYRTVYPLQSVASAKESKPVEDKHPKGSSKMHRPVVATAVASQAAVEGCGCAEGEDDPTPAPALDPVGQGIPAEQRPESTKAGKMLNSTTLISPPVVTAAAPTVRGEMMHTAALGASLLALAIVL